MTFPATNQFHGLEVHATGSPCHHAGDDILGVHDILGDLHASAGDGLNFRLSEIDPFPKR